MAVFFLTGENTAYLRYNSDSTVLELDVASANLTDKFLYKLHYINGGNTIDDCTWRNFGDVTVSGSANSESNTALTGVAADTMKITLDSKDDKGQTFQVEVKNVDTGEIFCSNSVTIK